MRLEFAKLNGLGNDFIMIDNMDGKISLSPEQVISLCDRHFGIGGDGVILVEAPREDGTDAFMNYINSDGTLAQMCGNGVRCFAKFLVDRNLVDDSGSLVAGTLAGRRQITYTSENGKLLNAKVNMGKPILRPELVPTTLKANAKSPDGQSFVSDQAIESPWGSFSFTVVSMGNPHAVCFLDNLDSMQEDIFKGEEKNLANLNLDLIGSFFEMNDAFPEKANIEFAFICPDFIEMRVWERGCGETLACGTGACATSVAASLTGRKDKCNSVKLLGGILNIDWDESGYVFMTGPADEFFTGYVDID